MGLETGVGQVWMEDIMLFEIATWYRNDAIAVTSGADPDEIDHLRRRTILLSVFERGYRFRFGIVGRI